MKTDFSNLTIDEKTEVLQVRYKCPLFFKGLIVFDSILFTALIIVAKLSDSAHLENFAFVSGVFISFLFLTIISYIRDKENWVNAQLNNNDKAIPECWDKETK